MSHISTDYSRTAIDPHVLTNKDNKNNKDITKNDNLTISDKSVSKDKNIKEKKLSSRRISINLKTIIYDTLSPEFLISKKNSALINTRHIQKYDSYC